MTSDNHSSFTAEESLKRLMDGNARFVGGQARFSTLPADVLPGLVGGQQPYATILGCSDSRVPPELVFDAGFGELFVVRVAGNTLGPSIEGTLQYARAHLHTPLLVVMGHEGCGAIKAAMDSKLHGIQHRSRIARLLENIFPALDDLDTKLPPDARIDAGVEANVRWTVRQVLESPEMQSAPAQDRIVVVGAVYGLQTGQVRFLE
jgi:carbonic anhydrase